ncbi:hypothetical protein SDC9_161622 [bioreactor metagenome]|uniref:Uncharacterized protein n=1 Tax=bioreactor metagenome TaxID=1076179 RepID=A0A645FKV6_9ZZZZ
MHIRNNTGNNNFKRIAIAVSYAVAGQKRRAHRHLKQLRFCNAGRTRADVFNGVVNTHAIFLFQQLVQRFDALEPFTDFRRNAAF